MKHEREHWIDAVKVFACILVTLGHFFQSMVKSGIIADSLPYRMFNQSIYTFHVPLFFICSGYLYQMSSRVNSLSSWKKSIVSKLISLGIPYVFFSTLTWGLKTVFSSQVNTAADSLFHSLIVSPLSPYWYLYTLFFIFVITPTFSGPKTAVCTLIAALVMKLIALRFTLPAEFLSLLFANEIWFVLGMCACRADIKRLFLSRRCAYIGLGSMFLYAACCALFQKSWTMTEQFFIGLFACVSVILLAGYACQHVRRVGMIQFLSQYTMPVFLMHTLFAAPWRIVLTKVGLSAPLLHIVSGIAISFAGPVIAAMIMSRIKWANFLLYPQKIIRAGK